MIDTPKSLHLTVALADLPSTIGMTDRIGRRVGCGGVAVTPDRSGLAAHPFRVPARTDRGEPVTLHLAADSLDPLERLTLREGQHRARNLVSLAVALTRQSLAPIQHDPLVVDLIDRLRSLDAVARIGCEVTGDMCPVEKIAEQVTARLDDPTHPRIARSGPEVSIVARWAHLLALVLHELTANALRHGALSVPDGHVDLRWAVTSGEDAQGEQLHVVWRETGGPAMHGVSPSGFGTRLLRDLIGSNRRCQATLRAPPSGLVYRLVLQLTDVEMRR